MESKVIARLEGKGKQGREQCETGEGKVYKAATQEQEENRQRK